MRITTVVRGAKEASSRLHGMTVRASDMRDALNRIADEFCQHEGTVFLNQGAIVGMSGWAPLSLEYAEEKARSGFSDGILVRTGKLRMSLTSKMDPYFVMRLTPKTLRIGTSVPYAKFHRSGTSKMPARDPIRITPAQRVRWAQILKDFVIRSKK